MQANNGNQRTTAAAGSDNNEATVGTPQWLALLVILLSVGGIVAVAILVISLRSSDALNVFNILVPVFASWVGVVLAFYFGQRSFETANRQVERVVRHLTPAQAASRKPTSSIMKTREQSIVYNIVGDSLEADPVTLQRILEICRTGNVSRLPVLSNENVVEYLIHEASIDHFLAGRPEQQTTTLIDFINVRPNSFDIGHGFTTVGPDASIRDVQVAMTAPTTVQDVIVTEGPDPRSAMKGWITNISLTRHLPAP